ncbi:43845_t:CDS:2, partial [Gigaspora margarita]
NRYQYNQIQNFQQNISQNIRNPIFNSERIKKDLITKINYLSEEQLQSCAQLFVNMIYKDGLYRGKFISPYLQKKAMEWIQTNYKKHNNSQIEQEIKSLKAENLKLKQKIYNLTLKTKSLTSKLNYFQKSKKIYISKIRSAIRRKRIFQQDKKTYTPEFISLLTNLCTINQISMRSTIQCVKQIVLFLTGSTSDSWLSISTLSKWTKEVAQISVQENLPQFSNQFSSYGIMADESTREAANNVPISYLKKWKTFSDFLQNERLNIEIQIMIRFGEWFYEKVMYFLTVEEWINELQIAIEHPDEVFVEELLAAYELLPINEFLDLSNKIENGLIKALESFKKWMNIWTHLPLSICRLGGICGPDFAVAIAKVILNIHLDIEPSITQQKYIYELLNDLKIGNKESFGLFQALENNHFPSLTKEKLTDIRIKSKYKITTIENESANNEETAVNILEGFLNFRNDNIF